MRYFLQLAYHGKAYSGWQRQPNAPTVQQVLETALSQLLRAQIEVTGCGRTDAGVHASYYIAHLDTEVALDQQHLRSLNAMLPHDVSVYRIWPVHPDAHARFSAYSRSYVYFLSTVKDPFRTETSWLYTQASECKLEQLNAAASVIRSYEEFLPFCKMGSDVEHYHCQVTEAKWVDWDGRGFQFHVSANRFLRGMVRLMVGACIEVGRGKLTLEQLHHALSTQTELPKPVSVPAHGLFLCDVKYPESAKS